MAQSLFSSSTNINQTQTPATNNTRRNRIIGVIAILLLIAALPITLIAINTSTETRQQATGNNITPTPTNCPTLGVIQNVRITCVHCTNQ